MSSTAVATPLSLLSPPYEGIRPVGGGIRQLKMEGRRPGCALVWEMGRGIHPQDAGVVRARPGGLPLLVILPPAEDLSRDSGLIRLLEEVRPQGILPHHEAPTPEDLACVLRQPPDDLGSEVTEYLRWRGIGLERDMNRLVRRIVTLSADLRSVSALARSMYLSRRALGRRFLACGLPVPSHWLHFARLLRVAIRLQNCEESVLSVGYELGYPGRLLPEQPDGAPHRAPPHRGAHVLRLGMAHRGVAAAGSRNRRTRARAHGGFPAARRSAGPERTRPSGHGPQADAASPSEALQIRRSGGVRGLLLGDCDDGRFALPSWSPSYGGFGGRRRPFPPRETRYPWFILTAPAPA